MSIGVDFSSLMRYSTLNCADGVRLLGNKNARISVLLTSEDFDRFAAYCENKAFKKSTLIARLIREHLDSEGFAHQVVKGMKAARKEVE